MRTPVIGLDFVRLQPTWSINQPVNQSRL